MAAKRLAITISGAVSLGSYEAGVLYELLTAIGQHNGHTDTLANPDERIEIDVLTGASAGGMTAAIAAQKLLAGGDALAGLETNSLYRPWVAEVDISGLLQGASGGGDDPTLSILASSLVEQLALDHMPDMQQGAPHPAAAKQIQLGLALSNLSGVDYHRATRSADGGGSFIYTRFQDEIIFELTAVNQQVTGDWAAIRRAAVACGAFPFAFRPQAIERAEMDYEGEAGLRPGQFPNGPQPFVYTDGGVFHNEPLGLAKTLVEKIDQRQDADSRFYLFVAPDAKVSKIPDPRPDAPTETMLHLAGHLVNAIFNQARFQDWVTAEKTNDHIALLNAAADQLAARLAGDPALEAALRTVTAALLPLYYPAPTAALTNGAIAANLLRLARQFAADSPQPSAPNLVGVSRDTWLRTLLLLEKAARLEEKEEMTIYTITAAAAELSGDPLVAFAGFFSETARRHDYEVGRAKVRDWIAAGSAPGSTGIFPIRYTPADLAPAPELYLINGKMNPELCDYPKDTRCQFVDRARDRIDGLLKELGFGGFMRWGLDLFVIGPKLRKYMGV